MSNTPEDRRYAKTHEWVLSLEDSHLLVGISDHAQEALGDLVFVELPEIGRQLEAGESCAVVESVKAASDIYAPVSGEVVEINEELADHPELINQDPYDKGWLWKMKAGDTDGVNALFDAAGYTAALDAEH